jgi:cyclophilin family peptidyl-prolyl cis-trans isomerase
MKRPSMSAPIPFATPAGPRHKATHTRETSALQEAPATVAKEAALPTVLARRTEASAKPRVPNQPRLSSKAKTRKSSTSRHQRRQRVIETLEQRQVFAAPTLGPIIDQSLSSGAPIQVAIAGDDADGDALTFTAISDNPNIVAELRATTNRYLVLNIQHTSSGQPGDSDFSGQLIFQLFEDLTPEVTNRIITLVNSGFYDNLIFHRVIDNFVIQGGDPLGNGTGGSGVQFDDEFVGDLQHTVSGLLSMAKSSDDTNDSQFFITEGPQRNLDFNHSIFGMMVVGESLRDQISAVPKDSSDKPLSAVTITSASIQTFTKYNVLTVKAAEGYTGSGTITVTADDGNGGTTQETFTVNATPDTNENRPFLNNAPLQIDAPAGGGAVTYQFSSTDVDGGPLSYYAFLENAADSSKVTISINKTTGLLTVTPVNGFSGVVNIFIVASPLGDADHEFIAQQATTQNITIKEAYNFYSLYYDMQSVPIVVAPAAPTSIDLLAGSDTGSSNSDNVTRNDNNGNTAALTFQVSGVTAGATVELYDGATLIGSALASGTTVNITTNGTSVLTNGLHSITARQVLANTPIDAGNQDRDVDITSTFSAPLNITIDTAIPIFTSQPVTSLVQFSTYNYDANTDDEAGTGAIYDLLNAPTGMTIDPNTGVVTWLPTQAQINAGFADVSIQATDAAGNVSTQVYTVTFVPNQAPTLDAVANQSVDEGTTFTYALVAQDPNLPGDTLTYSLISGPANASVNAATGVVTFAPNDSDGSTTKTLTVRVTDAGGEFAERTFDIVVNDTNSNPVVAAIGTQTVTENQELVVAINATDVDIPADTLSYELLSGPAGTTIDANGVIRWTPGEADGGTQRTISFKVNDSAGGSTTVSFLVNVTEQNQNPVLTVQTSHTINEFQTLTFTASATDADAPAQPLVFGLNTNAPAGMTINTSTGVISWTPTEAQGPATYTVQIIVIDNLGGSDTEFVTITVNEVNQAPYLGTLNVLDAFPGTSFTAQIPGFDGDLPGQSLFYELDSAPAGLSIDPTTGLLSWALPSGAAEGIQTITVRLTDAFGESVTQQYQIRVSSLNFGNTFGLVSQWTSTVVPTTRDNRPVETTTLQTVARLIDGEVAPVSILGDNTANSVESLLGGLNRIQAVDGPTVVEAMKPEGDAAGTNNETNTSGDAKADEKPQLKSSGNPFDNTSAPVENPASPAGGLNKQSRWQRRFDWREHLRAAALVETALTENVDLNWVNRAPQTPVLFEVQPESPVAAVEIAAANVVAVKVVPEQQPGQAQEPTESQPLAASAVGIAAAGMMLRKRNTSPVSIPLVNDEVRRKRGPRKNWY